VLLPCLSRFLINFKKGTFKVEYIQSLVCPGNPQWRPRRGPGCHPWKTKLLGCGEMLHRLPQIPIGLERKDLGLL